MVLYILIFCTSIVHLSHNTISSSKNTCYVWEYGHCTDSIPHYAPYNYSNNGIQLPIFQYSVPVKKLDSLCSKFLEDYNLQEKVVSSMSVPTFGTYFYTDSLISMSVIEVNVIGEGLYSYKCYIDKSKFGLLEDVSCQFIYVPTIGIVYASTSDEDGAPILARLTDTCQAMKQKNEITYNKIMAPYVYLKCW